MALVAGATRITMDGLRAIDVYDSEPFTVVRPATLAEQLSVMSAADVLRLGVGIGAVSVAGSVISLTVAE